MRVLLTGATGFLGKALARHLLAQGHDVVAAVRATSNTQPLEAMGVTCERCDLLDEASILAALGGVSAVVHAAGGGYALRGSGSIYRSNRDTTAALCAAADRAPSVDRVVLVSSVAAQGPSPAAHSPRADAAPGPTSRYGRAKAEAEALVLDPARQFAAVVLRPPTIYGPGDDRLLPLFRGVARGIAALPRGARGASWLHVEDCAEALALAVSAPLPPCALYGIADGPPRPWPEAIACIAEAVGRPARIVRVPHALLYASAAAAETLAGLTGRPLLFTRDKVGDMTQPWWVAEHERLPEALGWKPRQRFEEGVRELAAWYREEGLLPRR